MKDLATNANAWETPQWAINAILDKEIMTHKVIDPCCGRGVLSDAAAALGHHVIASDLYNWGYGNIGHDFLNKDYPHNKEIKGATILMNPPFEQTIEFIEKALKFGARKIIVFEKYTLMESVGRRSFFEQHPPNRIYTCGNRASCRRQDIPLDVWEKMESTTTAHAWFIWEQGHPTGTLNGHIYKKETK
jgi:predicted RNA methylase